MNAPTTDISINHFKRAIEAGTLQIGIWSGLSNNITVEVLANAGFDWLLLDAEHSPNELPMVYSQLQAISRGRAHPIARPPWNDTVTVKRYLDIGVQTLLIPFIQNARGALDAVAATRYPPPGVRGYSAAARASDYGCVKNYPALCEEHLCVLLQVETPEAIANIGHIAAVDASASGGRDRGRGGPHPRLRQGGRYPGRRRATGPPLHRDRLQFCGRRQRHRHPGTRRGSACSQIQAATSSMSKVGFIGLGIMGAPMAAHILNGGHQLYVHDILPLPADLAGQGAVACGSGKEAAQHADIVIIMVPDTPHVAAVLFDDGGVAQGLASGKIVVDMSSISPIDTKRFALKINAPGCNYLDAPVSVGEALLFASRILEVHGERMIERMIEPGFRIELHQKNLNLALSSARAVGLSLPNTATAQELFNRYAAHGGKAWDHSALVRALEMMANDEIGAPVPE